MKSNELYLISCVLDDVFYMHLANRIELYFYKKNLMNLYYVISYTAFKKSSMPGFI